MENICYNCFSDSLNDAGICEKCGFDGAKNREKYPLALPLGSILYGRYIVGRVLGQGGFGITYLAQDYQTKGLVAIKEFFPEAMATRTEKCTVTPFSGERGEPFAYGLNSFLEEAKTMAEFIGNPNITRVDSYFEENGTGYFVMEYLDGDSFLDYIKSHGGRLSWEDTMQVALPIMDALAAMHEKGIIHRDVTPDNIYITKDGTVKLLDFGAARYSLGNVSRSLDVILKHGFAPKEQYSRRGKQGPFTDVYSLGATIYYALTGVKPDDAIERLEEDQTPLPTTLGARISNSQEGVVMRALAVMPNDRYQNIPQFRAAILAAKPLPKPKPKPEPKPKPAPKPKPKPEPKPKKKLPKWLIPGVAAVALAVGIGIWVVKPAMDYKAAQERMDAGAYGEAAEAFEALGNYRDSSEKLTELIGNVSCTYEENGEGLTITGYSGSLLQAVILPRVINNQIVTEIGENAFCGSTNLTSVTIPDSVTSIGMSAFDGCTSLTSITIPDSVTSIDGAFCGCTGLTGITIPDSVTSIDGAFDGCTSLESVTIPNGVTSIGVEAFKNCANLTGITIPDSVTSIGMSAFDGCTSLTGIAIPDSVTSIGMGAFYGCTSLTSITIPDSVTSIETWTFEGCTSLESVTIPDSVTSIGLETFKGCTSLTSITIPDSVTSIGKAAFMRCTSLTSIAIPNGVTSIEGWAFQFCTSLTDVAIPDSVTSIEDRAFEGCASLESITIPNSVTSIGHCAFRECIRLTSVTIPDSVTSISTAFEGCSSLTRVSIPRKCTLGEGTFLNRCKVTRR